MNTMTYRDLETAHDQLIMAIDQAQRERFQDPWNRTASIKLQHLTMRLAAVTSRMRSKRG